MMNCPFCSIDKERNRVVKEGRLAFVILSNPRLMPGHTLVIPKRHIERPSDLTVEERKELFDTTLEFQDIILKNISSGCDISQHCRPFLPESRLKVNHVHFHLRPREFKDEFYQKCMVNEAEMFKDLADEEAKRMINILKK